MKDSRNEIRALMRRLRDGATMPSSRKIVSEALSSLGCVPQAIEPNDVLAQFNSLLRSLSQEALHVFEHHEDQAYAEGIFRELAETHTDHVHQADRLAQDRGFSVGVLHLFASWYPLLRHSFLSISQSRKARAGKTFQLQIEGLLDLARVPYDRQLTLYRNALILPDIETHQRNRNISAVISVKRTLRERWAEVAEELFNLRSPNLFLFTADDGVTQRQVDRICTEYKIDLVVWDEVKAAKFADEPLVMGYTQWATERLSQLQQQW